MTSAGHHIKLVGKYLTVGLIGITTNLACFKLGLVLGLHYLTASTLALSISTVVGFLLQKFWTFKGDAALDTRWQFILYIATALFNLGINAIVVYCLVDRLYVHPLMAQFLGAGVVAVSSFFVYKYGVFKHHGSSIKLPL